MNKRTTGSEYENLSCEYLNKHGLKILERNFRCRIGEIDIIAKDGDYYVFIEVKYRLSDEKGLACEAVDRRKQRKICKVSDYYRLIKELGEFTPVRFDVITITGREINWYKNAFEYTV
ncbi:MAG: YraN family protein [Lachnospiraceae bacterium]|nr:YraN family protein [Lachnospiraceae bacterium]